MDQIHKIEGKLTVHWVPEVRAIVDTWSNYFVTLAEFKEAVMGKGLEHARAYMGHAWIVDSSTAKGAFPAEIQAFIESDCFPAFAKHGIKWFLTISSTSAITNMSIGNYVSKLGPAGIKLVEASSVEGAVSWLKSNM